MEAAFVFDKHGTVIHWHLPADRSQGAIPDSQELWDILWDNRELLGGVAHSHPWHGDSWFSQTDVTTFSAVERGLGRRLVWPVVSFSSVSYFEWVGPGLLDYGVVERRRFRLKPEDIEHLRDLSR